MYGSQWEASCARCLQKKQVLKMKPEEATKMIYKVDKARTAYHKRYAKYAPGDPDSKQIMIDSSMLGVRGTAEILAEIVQKRFGV